MKSFVFFFVVLMSSTVATDAKPLTVGFLTGIGGLGDHGFNDMAYAGLARAKKEFGLKLIPIQPKNVNDTIMQRLLKEKPDVIVCNGFEWIDLVKKYARLHPETRFVVNDIEVKGFPNVASILYSQHEGSFLAGALAGWMSKTEKVGFIGGVDHPVIHAFRVGFREGVRYANPQVNVMEVFIAPENDFSGFDNPKKGHRVATDFYQKGADIIFAAAGTTGNGVIWAAQQQKKFVIGVDSDQDHMARGHVLTSMMKRLDQAVFREISRIQKGEFKAGIHFYGIKEKGVGLSKMKYTRHLIPKNILEKLEDVEAGIRSGNIRVTNYLKKTEF